MEPPKTFLLVMPEYSDFPDLFMKNLKKSGFRVSIITDKLPDFRYQGNATLLNFFKKTYLKDKLFKKEHATTFKH